MKRTFSIMGMTCQGCVASVKERLLGVQGVHQVEVDLDAAEAEISMEKQVSISQLKSALPQKYQIEATQNITEVAPVPTAKSKLQQLRPLFLIFFYLFGAAFLLNYADWNSSEAMLDFMGLFYIVFSFFKLLDLKGFPDSFRIYDPLAKAIPVYAWIYPFLELALGLSFLMRFQVGIALIATLVILGITTLGVTKTLLDKKSIRCACLGTALNLPMTEATFIENTIMLVMASVMLFST
ncbi:MAG: heavy metal transporter [Allomuricauda sp.]|nr:MAG: heavy metal transporter [Allomuricauda sp.]